ncbi:MAG: hypothetical protein ACTSQH_02560 [Candidatus Hodarchaeales archaeon]
MSLEKDLRNILVKLRKDDLLDENLLINRLNELESLRSINSKSSLEPFFAIVRIVDQNNELEKVKKKTVQLESVIEDVISSWENTELSNDEARKKITHLVSSKQSLSKHQEHLTQTISTSVNRLKTLLDLSGIRSQDLFTKQNNKKIDEILSACKFIWDRVQKSDILSTDSKELKSLSIIETDILDAFVSPVSEQNQIKFKLGELIKPLPEIISPQTLLQKSHKLGELPKSEQIIPDQVDLWSFVGKIAITQQKIPLGLFRAPVSTQNQLYLPIVLEESVTFSDIKKKLGSQFDSFNIDPEDITTEEFQKIIASTLNIPLKLAFQPSIINEWLRVSKQKTAPFKPRIANVQFLKGDKLKSTNEESVSVNENDLEKIRLTAWIPAPSLAPSFTIEQGQTVNGMAGTHFGNVDGLMEKTPFGHVTLIKREIPPSSIIDQFLQGLAKRNLAELRFHLAKKLKIGEGEVFSADNLWTINYQERMLISPHELAISYYALLPSSALFLKDGLKAKIGIYFHSLTESLRFLNGKALYKDNVIFGAIYGFKIVQNQLMVLYSSLSGDELVQKVGRKHSQHNLERFQKRVSLALAVPEKESLMPNNLARYYMNFIWMEEFHSLTDAMTTVEDKFVINQISFAKFNSITEDGLFC